MDRKATAVWQGTLKEGKGTLDTQSGALKDLPYDFKGRFVDESGRSGTNPEELLGAAHAGCFAMQLSAFLAEHGTPAEKLEATATVKIGPAEGGGFEISRSALTLNAAIPGISVEDFEALANKAKQSCPLSKALGAIEVTLDARLA
ncbi:osmotically inducible protein OsmC [Ochrobactrum daejeonense]|uniref:Osmotically inducible protein OsmC n=1 Tax=Brucella daejeonensis TaxID=659015 RepID=A0A7W9AU00_9HYPH|nr:OsmC family protein [Brucella daejeonensis]MBB5700555.1 osmotically inducible protein OsmC [Brucella daejeonensis]NKB78371.1 OsmC family protein [Brucella daejeonensis]